MESVVNNKLSGFYQGKKVFVTGHTGFKGSWLISWLHTLGAEVMGYSLAPDYERNIYNTISTCIPYQNLIADIRDAKKLEESLINFKPDYIFHLAAQSLVRTSYKQPALTFDVNVTGTGNLLQALIKLKSKCTVIIVTTDKVYENDESGKFFSETDRLGGHDPYSASKACVELLTS